MANTSEYIRLKELGKSKFEVAKNQYDIRGWTVKNSLGRIIGKVNDLLFDTESQKVLYMVLDLEGNEMHLRDRKVLAPLNLAEINEAYHNVTFPGTMANELTELPTYEKGKASTRIEDLVLHAFSNNARGGDTQEQRNAGRGALEGHHRSDTTVDHHRSDQTIGQQSSDNRSRPQTVVGVFEHSSGGQLAVEQLLSSNFKRDQIEISGKGSEYSSGQSNSDDNSVSNWFKSIFGNDKDASTYSDAAKTGCIVSVHTSSIEDANQVAAILDKHGAVAIDDSSRGQPRNYRSRILDRSEGSHGQER